MMRQETINLYQFDELSERAQRRAWENGPDLSGDSGYEFRATLEAFEKAFDIKVYHYNVDDYTYSFDFVTAGRATEAPEGDALRLARYMWNNYASEIMRGKYYSTGKWVDGKYQFKSRHSKINMEMDNCPFTGVFCDMDILGPIIACLHYREFFESFDDLITACLNDFFKAWQAEIEYRGSLENFAETAAANEWEFTETGEMWCE